MEGVLRYTIEFHQTPFGITPEAFNPVDVCVAPGELIFAVVDFKVFVKADINQTVVAAPTVSVNYAGYTSALPLTMACKIALEALGMISVDTLLPRLNRPNTTVLLPAPRPHKPRIRREPKYDPSACSSPPNGET